MSLAEGPFYQRSLVTPRLTLQYDDNLPTVRAPGGEGLMEELIGRLVADIGIDRAAAERSVGIIPEFMVSEGPADKVQPLLAKLPAICLNGRHSCRDELWLGRGHR